MEIIVQNEEKKKARRKAYAKAYYERNKEFLDRQCKEWRADNPEKWKESQRKSMERNAEKIRARKLKDRTENPEKYKAYQKRALEKRNCEEFKARRRASYAANLEKERERQKEWNDANPEKCKAKSRKHYLKRKSLGLPAYLSAVEWRKNNREILNKKKREWHSLKIKTDPSYKARHIIRSRISELLSVVNAEKCTTGQLLIGCTPSELKSHIESQFLPGMHWGNHGQYRIGGEMKWHIDHILPCASFNLLDPAQQRACFHYTNLQPLWAVDNLRKGSTILN